MAIRVLIAEDNALLREGCGPPDRARRRHRARRDRAPTSPSCSSAVEEHRPTSSSPTSACRRPAPTRASGPPRDLREHPPRLGVVVLSQYAEPGVRAGPARARAPSGRAYLLKERVADVDELLGAIREVARRRLGHRPQGRRGARRGPSEPPRRRSTASRPRETEILGEMAQGKNNAAIAATLVLSRAGRREAHQLDLLQARPDRGARREPPGQGGAACTWPNGGADHTRPRGWTLTDAWEQADRERA